MSDIRLMAAEEVNQIDGGLIPAIAAGVMLYNYAAAAYGGATVAAWSAGAIAGAGLMFAAE